MSVKSRLWVGPKFITWTTQNGRTADLASELNIDPIYIYPRGNTLVRYGRSFVETWKIFRELGTGSAVVMLPPLPLLLCAVLASAVYKTNTTYDLHTGFFYDPKWSWARSFSLAILRRRTCIVTNENLATVLHRKGISPIVLHDKLTPRAISKVEAGRVESVVCPVSYSNDEPISALLGAASRTPHLIWYFTGKAPQKVQETAPANVVFTGFLSEADYDALLSSAGTVMALTTRVDTMQRAGYEALMSGVPLVTSNFAVLKNFFGDGALYADPTASSIAEAATRAIEEGDQLRALGASVLAKQVLEQSKSLSILREVVWTSS